MTLLELVVAISIILSLALLTMMLLPRIKSTEDIAKCASNLRLIAVGFNSYVSDQNGHFPTRFWSRVGPDGILDYTGLPQQNILADTIFTCPALQREAATRSVDLLHRNYGINLYATTEKANEGFNTRIVNVEPGGMMLATEGRVLNELTNAQGHKGVQYQTSTRSTHMPEGGGWNYPHGGFQNILFMDGSVQRVSRAEALLIGADKLFWHGKK